MNNRVHRIIAFCHLNLGVHEPEFYSQVAEEIRVWSVIWGVLWWMFTNANGKQKGHDGNESISSHSNYNGGRMCLHCFTGCWEIHGVVPWSPASSSQDKEQCAHCPQPGAQEVDRLRGWRGGPAGLPQRYRCPSAHFPQQWFLRLADHQSLFQRLTNEITLQIPKPKPRYTD